MASHNLFKANDLRVAASACVRCAVTLCAVLSQCELTQPEPRRRCMMRVSCLQTPFCLWLVALVVICYTVTGCCVCRGGGSLSRSVTLRLSYTARSAFYTWLLYGSRATSTHLVDAQPTVGSSTLRLSMRHSSQPIGPWALSGRTPMQHGRPVKCLLTINIWCRGIQRRLARFPQGHIFYAPPFLSGPQKGVGPQPSFHDMDALTAHWQAFVHQVLDSGGLRESAASVAEPHRGAES
jgi:hypothetical protein